MEIDNKTRERIFALYWGQKIGVNRWTTESTPAKIDAQFMHYMWHEGNSSYLLITPLSQITDEDALGLWDIIRPKDKGYTEAYRINEAKSWLNDEFNIGDIAFKYSCFDAADYLRSRGYALPAFGFSVDDLVSAGVFKLKEG